MGIDIKISIELSPLQKKIVRTAVVAGAVIGALGIGLAIALPKHTFVNATVISANDMNENFNDLDSRLQALEARTTLDGGYSANAVWCGKSNMSPNGQFTNAPTTSYTFAKTQCETACSSKLAHMCTAEEVLRSAQLNMSVPMGWITQGQPGLTQGAGGYGNGTNVFAYECVGFSSAAPSLTGSVWAKSGFVQSDLCSNSNPILCCD